MTDKKKRPNGAGAPYETDDGRWRMAVELQPGPDGTRRRKYISGKSPEDVKRQAKKIRQQVDAGLNLSFELRTVAQFLEWWESEVLPGSVDQSSQDTYSNTLRLWVVPHVGSVKLSELRPMHVTRMLRRLEDAGYSRHTRSMARRVLGRALRRAEQEGWVLRNAAQLADSPHMDEDERDYEDDDSPVFTVEQARAFLEAAKDHRYGGPMAVQLALGLRRGEALGLSRRNLFIDSDPPCIKVRQQLIRLKGAGLVIRKVKTKKGRLRRRIPGVVATLTIRWLRRGA